MKKMRRVVASLLALGMAFALTACGGKEQTATYRMEQDLGVATMTDTMTFTAKGDKVTKITEEMKLEGDALDDAMKTQCDSLVEQYKSVAGVECTGESSDNAYTIKVDIDASGDTIKQLADLGLLTIEGDSNGISLKASGTALEASGYSKVE